MLIVCNTRIERQSSLLNLILKSIRQKVKNHILIKCNGICYVTSMLMIIIGSLSIYLFELNVSLNRLANEERG